MDYAKRVKRIFASRLVKYINEPSKIIGFMPDIYRICGKYNLTNILNVYVRKRVISCNSRLEKYCKNAIRQKANTDLSHRLLNDEGLVEFTVIHNQYIPCSIWRFGQIYRHYLPYCKTAATIIGKLCSSKYLVHCPKMQIRHRVNSGAYYFILS